MLSDLINIIALAWLILFPQSVDEEAKIKRSRDFPQVSELVIFLLLLYPLLARWGEWQFERERGEDKAIGTDF